MVIREGGLPAGDQMSPKPSDGDVGRCVGAAEAAVDESKRNDPGELLLPLSFLTSFATPVSTTSQPTAPHPLTTLQTALASLPPPHSAAPAAPHRRALPHHSTRVLASHQLIAAWQKLTSTSQASAEPRPVRRSTRSAKGVAESKGNSVSLCVP